MTYYLYQLAKITIAIILFVSLNVIGVGIVVFVYMLAKHISRLGTQNL
jgi:hypothetical protein